MATKTISIMDDVYRLLVLNKLAGESFSDVMRRTLKRKRNIMEFAGAWSDMSEKETEKMKKDIVGLRKSSTNELLRNTK